MGCGGSRLGSVAARTDEAGVVPIPAGIRPLLRRRLEEMKKRSHVSVLKGNQTLSKKELLRHGSSEDGEETEENDGSFLKSSAKVAPVHDHHMEEKKEVIYEKISSRDDVREVKDEEVLKKHEKNHDDDMAINKGDHDGINHHDDDDEGRMSNFDERMICPGSPSFRVYCIDATFEEEEEDKVGIDTRKSIETENVMREHETKEDESNIKKVKRERKGKRFGIALPKKYLANVTAPCYATGGGCMGNTHSSLIQEKSRQ